MTQTPRAISWIKAARKDFEDFPPVAQLEGLRALTVAAEGSKADNVKPLKGFGSGVMEIVYDIAAMRSASSIPCRSARTCGVSMRFRKNPRKE
jgi:phage-related protein